MPVLEALLCGKLSSSQENMEDLLTSCVFGAFKYLSYKEGLGAFLRQARSIELSNRPFSGLDIQSAVFDFWPFWSEAGYENCEPDVVISAESSGRKKFLIAIEVKYRSGKSAVANDESEAPTDQLAKEWDHLTRLAAKEGSVPMLVYVTSDAVIPLKDIAQASEEYSKKRGCADGAIPFQCSWISWRSLFRALNDAVGELAEELRKLASKLEFREFDGFSDMHAEMKMSWRYNLVYDWSNCSVGGIYWSYGNDD